jgi:hypothetical protein
MEELRLGEATVSVFSAVRGLPSEGEAVKRAVDAGKPDIVALSVSREELDALRSYRGVKMEPDTTEDEVYVAGLSAWEEPVMPPPCFTQAARIATTRSLRLEALDLSEEDYADAYTRNVTAMELLLQGRMESRLLKRRFRVSTPQEFAIAWDAEVNRTSGFARLQREREEHIAKRLRELAQSKGRVLAVIEVERVKGVLAALRG